MAIGDLLWACPVCRSPGTVRRVRPSAGPNFSWRRRTACIECKAVFTRADGADIAISHRDGRTVRSAREWAALIGPLIVPAADESGRVMGPDRVLIRRASHHRPLRFGNELLGWIEGYQPRTPGSLLLLSDRVRFQPDEGIEEIWHPADLTGIQPASSTVQLAFGRAMVSIRFAEASVRLWTSALSSMVRSHHAIMGCDVVELQPRIRLRPALDPPSTRETRP